MRRSVPIAVLTSFVFMWAVLWPDVARARETAPPPASPSAASDDAAMAGAKQHFEAGRQAYNAGDFPAAIREFKAAEALRPSPVLAYNIGLANEKLARKRVAVRYYKRYLEGAPSAPNRGEVEGRIATLEREIAAQPQQQPQESPQDNPPPAAYNDPNNPPPPTVQSGQDPYAGQPVTTAPPVRKKHNLWWVWLIVGIGASAVIAGIVVGVIYGVRSNSVYYYDGKIAPDRLNLSAERTPVMEKNGAVLNNAAMPAGLRNAEVAPIVQIHF